LGVKNSSLSIWFGHHLHKGFGSLAYLGVPPGVFHLNGGLVLWWGLLWWGLTPLSGCY